MPHDNLQPHQLLLGCVIALLGLGTVMVYSATIAGDSAALGASYHHLIRHGMHIGLGAGLLWFVTTLSLAWLQTLSRVGLLLGLVLLLVVLIPNFGLEVNGSYRWLRLGRWQFQPSEFVKIAAIFYFADYLARKSATLHLFRVGIFNSGLVLGVLGLLLLLEPDFATTVILLTTVSLMMFLAGVRFWHFLVSSSVAAMVVTAIMWMQPYRVARLVSYLDPWAHPFDSGFQLGQALIAIGRGEWLGSGLGSSIQKLFYLPHAGNDFLIAIIGEELGAVGIFAVLALFVVFLHQTFAIATAALQRGWRFGGFLAQGLGLLITIQALIHTGVNLGLLPTTGLTLPLLSYGGSSLLSNMLAIGLLIAVAQQCQTEPLTPVRAA